MSTATPTPTRTQPWMHNRTTERYVTVMDGEWYAVDYSLQRGNEVYGPFATEDQAVQA